jgi:UDP-N-acetylmuramoyl-tripeptide--D-alanyl-D-alanine ligase
MRELGDHSEALHAGLAPALQEAQVDSVILIGDEMAPLAEALDTAVAQTCVTDVEAATAALLAMVQPGDAVLVKASNSVGLAKLVERVSKELACST